jgi:hypothetical protein
MSESPLLTNFVPWEEDSQGWRQAARESFSGDDSMLLRTVWVDPGDDSRVVLIDAYRTSSSQRALSYLGNLARNLMRTQLSLVRKHFEGIELPFSDEVVSQTSDVRGNICLALSSLGSTKVDVREWADRLYARIQMIPSAEQMSLHIVVEKPNIMVGEDVAINYSLPWRLGRTGYYKFFGSSGQLFLKAGQLYFHGAIEGEAIVHGFAVESAHQPYGGTAVVEVHPRRRA